MMSLIDELIKLIPPEKIDGVNLDDVVQHVMLDVEFTPVVFDPLGYDPAVDHWEYPPMVSRVQASGARWCVWLNDERKYAWATDEELKRMRARYLLLRDFYTSHMTRFSHTVQQRVMAAFFPRGLYIPNVLQDHWDGKTSKD